MREFLQDSYSLWIAVFRLKNDGALEGFDDAALPWNAEFSRELRVNVCDMLHN